MALPSNIDSILKKKYGIDVSILGDTLINNIIRTRQEFHSDTTPSEYFDRLTSSPAEFNTFLEALLVPETWFFRDLPLFSHLKTFLAKKQPQHLNILSLPCATGEEPYSIAITLLESGYSPSQFTITAADLSSEFIEKAKVGIYKKIAFRASLIHNDKEYFTEIEPGKFQISDKVKKCVQFTHANIVDPTLFINKPPFEIILSRNVLIYFSEDARKQAISNLERLLAPEGLLFVGHADSITASSSAFSSIGDPAAFGYCKASASDELKMLFGSTSPRKASKKPTTEAKKAPRPRPSLEADAPTDQIIRHAEGLIKEGKYSDAEVQLNRILKTNPDFTPALTALESIYNTMGNFNKAALIQKQINEIEQQAK